MFYYIQNDISSERPPTVDLRKNLLIRIRFGIHNAISCSLFFILSVRRYASLRGPGFLFLVITWVLSFSITIYLQLSVFVSVVLSNSMFVARIGSMRNFLIFVFDIKDNLHLERAHVLYISVG